MVVGIQQHGNWIVLLLPVFASSDAVFPFSLFFLLKLKIGICWGNHVDFCAPGLAITQTKHGSLSHPFLFLFIYQLEKKKGQVTHSCQWSASGLAPSLVNIHENICKWRCVSFSRRVNCVTPVEGSKGTQGGDAPGGGGDPHLPQSAVRADQWAFQLHSKTALASNILCFQKFQTQKT